VCEKEHTSKEQGLSWADRLSKHQLGAREHISSEGLQAQDSN